MFKSTLIATVLFTAVFAAHFEPYAFENNLVEYDLPVHLRKGLSLPYYPYKENQEIRVEPVFQSDIYEPVVVPAVPSPPVVAKEVGLSKLGLISTVAFKALAIAKASIVFLFANGPALIIGSLVALGLCKFTPICSKFSSVKSLLEAQQEIRSFATPERIARAAEFVQTAIRKYSDLQKD